MKLLVTLLVALAAFGAPQQQTQPRTTGSIDAMREAAQPLGAEPVEVLNLEKAWAGVEPLLQIAANRNARQDVRSAAVRALGRLQDPRVVPQLLALRGTIARGRIADAIAQSLHGFDSTADPALIEAATGWMFDLGSVSITSNQVLDQVTDVSGALARIAFTRPAQVHDVEKILVKIANFAGPDYRLRGVYISNAHNLESLTRRNSKVTGIDEDTAERLKKMVANSSGNDIDEVRFYAFLALNSGRALDVETERLALKDTHWQTRRVAVSALAGGGAGLNDGARLEAIGEALGDDVPQVRYEALRAYVRRTAPTQGCAPIEPMLHDADQHVSLAAFDALGDLCKDDAELTERLAAEVRVPPASGSWHRDTHAFVALAKRSPARAAPMMGAFVAHPVWWVRMYAAGAAAVAGDLLRLEKLVYDSNDNVREAALEPWRRLKKMDADPAILDALERNDVQLLRTAATLLKDSPKSERIYRALLGALNRLTKEGKETSRDARLPLLEAIAMHASPEHATELVPLLKDFDPKIAETAAQIIIRLSGKMALPEPLPYPRGWPQEFKDLRQCVTVQLDTGRSFHMSMLPAAAPIAVDRFLKLALKDRYYDGLSFHRVVPNFVLQGGSPGANEYTGAREFMRDEISASNTRGTVGLSTRGRNTGDAQFYINLVDNPRLDGDYTVFARLTASEDVAVTDVIQEGDVIRSIYQSKCPK